MALAIASGAPVTLDVAGRYAQNVAGRNVVARLGPGKGPAIVVSTPMTGWYSCVCELGPGIANFLALARTVAAEKLPGEFIFVATAGHEIRLHSVNQVVKSWIGARSVIRLFGSSSGSALPSASPQITTWSSGIFSSRRTTC